MCCGTAASEQGQTKLKRTFKYTDNEYSLMEKNNFHWYVFLIITFLVWGTQHPPIKVLSGEISPFLFNFLRFSIAGVVLLPFVMKNRVKVDKKDLMWISVLGLVGIYLFGVFNIFGVRMSTASNNAILLNSWPLLLVLIAPIFIREKITKKILAGTVIGFIGVVLVITKGVLSVDLLMRSEYFTGDVLILISALCITINSMFIKKYVDKYGGLTVTFYSVVAGTFALLLSSIIAGDIFSVNKIGFDAFLLILWVAIPTTALTWVIWYESIKRIGAVKTSSFFFLIPVSGVLTSYIFLNEELTVFTVAGTALILFGVYVVQRK